MPVCQCSGVPVFECQCASVPVWMCEHKRTNSSVPVCNCGQERVKKANIIKMKFTDFHIEYFSCYYDFVYVYEDGVQSAKICGSKNDPPFQIHANRTFFAKNQLRISFHTDAYDIFEGFRAVFSFGK